MYLQCYHATFAYTEHSYMGDLIKRSVQVSLSNFDWQLYIYQDMDLSCWQLYTNHIITSTVYTHTNWSTYSGDCTHRPCLQSPFNCPLQAQSFLHRLYHCTLLLIAGIWPNRLRGGQSWASEGTVDCMSRVRAEAESIVIVIISLKCWPASVTISYSHQGRLGGLFVYRCEFTFDVLYMSVSVNVISYITHSFPSQNLTFCTS